MYKGSEIYVQRQRHPGGCEMAFGRKEEGKEGGRERGRRGGKTWEVLPTIHRGKEEEKAEGLT